jgi:phage baseplate assembly protein W
MASLSIQLPITSNSADGQTMIKTIKKMVNQNLKMLILTNPGERVMEPNFGVGMQQYLFAAASEGIEGQISQRIRDQVRTYLPNIVLNDLQFGYSQMDENIMGLRIVYSIPAIGLQDLLDLTI